MNRPVPDNSAQPLEETQPATAEPQEFAEGEAGTFELEPLEEDASAPAEVRRGVSVIREAWRTLPMGPGVYRMLAADGEVLYVGKAKSLKKRVASYARGFGHSARIARMIAATASMAFVTTRTEIEALLLEANFIKQMKPRFNV